MRDVILLGTHFMFREELGSRLRGIGYIVHPYDDLVDLRRRLDSEEFRPVLIIVDLQYEASGGLETVRFLKEHGKKVLAIGEHKSAQILQQARDLDADKVIINSQASKNIEQYVAELLD